MLSRNESFWCSFPSKLGIFPDKSGTTLVDTRRKKVSKDQTLRLAKFSSICHAGYFSYNDELNMAQSRICSAFEHYYKCSHLLYDYTRMYTKASRAQKNINQIEDVAERLRKEALSDIIHI